ncbi:hypothetical protein [Flavobacterium aestuarii]|uniref:hypothetical protein n=1 Tax=Flavobacterium aestuarii TaxID=3149227 RepID=UPI0032B58D5D
MRTIITFSLCLSFFSAVYSQDQKTADKNEETINMKVLPEVLVSHTKNVSKYIPDNNPDAVIRNTQNEFISYKIDNNEYQNFDEYLVTLENEKGFLAATYNQNGVLVRVNEKYTNAELPREIMRFVFMWYPDWTITKSKFEYSQQKGAILKKTYHLKLKKDNQTKNIQISPTGKIVETNNELAMN